MLVNGFLFFTERVLLAVERVFRDAVAPGVV
jgi:hypothetical protein